MYRAYQEKKTKDRKNYVKYRKKRLSTKILH